MKLSFDQDEIYCINCVLEQLLNEMQDKTVKYQNLAKRSPKQAYKRAEEIVEHAVRTRTILKLWRSFIELELRDDIREPCLRQIDEALKDYNRVLADVDYTFLPKQSV